ncbi:unnamed protein product, partial [Allacma fusca]
NRCRINDFRISVHLSARTGKALFLFSDRGKEYVSGKFRAFPKENKINPYHIHSRNKAAISERYIPGLFEKLQRFMTENNTRRIDNVLQQFVATYNNTYHRAIGRLPRAVTIENQHDVWERMFGKYLKEKNDMLRKPSKYHVNDLARISRAKLIFEKGYSENYFREVFRVTEVQDTLLWTYLLEDLSVPLEGISGQFNEAELTLASYPEKEEEEGGEKSQKQPVLSLGFNVERFKMGKHEALTPFNALEFNKIKAEDNLPFRVGCLSYIFLPMQEPKTIGVKDVLNAVNDVLKNETYPEFQVRFSNDNGSLIVNKVPKYFSVELPYAVKSYFELPFDTTFKNVSRIPVGHEVVEQEEVREHEAGEDEIIPVAGTAKRILVMLNVIENQFYNSQPIQLLAETTMTTNLNEETEVSFHPVTYVPVSGKELSSLRVDFMNEKFQPWDFSDTPTFRPHSQSNNSSGSVDNQLIGGGSAGLTGEASNYLIPLKSALSTDKSGSRKRKRTVQQVGGSVKRRRKNSSTRKKAKRVSTTKRKTKGKGKKN